MIEGRRARFYRSVFAGAAIYNIAFGAWAGFCPRSFFDLFQMDQPRYPSIWACLGMVVGLYGLVYGYCALRLDAARPLIGIGLLGKVLGPVGWVLAVHSGEFPARTWLLIVLNDILWWLPFGLYLLGGSSPRAE